MKGIILAGGSGTRLHPLTLSISKQLLPVYDKPMIYYPLTTLISGGVRDILIISTPRDLPIFKELLGDGSNLGIQITYKEQSEPKGIAQAFIIGEDFIENDPVSLILGDNIFHGSNIHFQPNPSHAMIWVTPVKYPNRYGVLHSRGSRPLEIIEKPDIFISNNAVTGLYRYPNDVIDIAKGLKPSSRGELEITDINNHYIRESRLSSEYLGSSNMWLDAGTHQSLHHASSYVETIQERVGTIVGCPEAVAWERFLINDEQLLRIADRYNNSYGDYLRQLVGRL